MTPYVVFLRNGEKAEIVEVMRKPGLCRVFTLFGFTSDRAPHLWRRDGRWCENGQTHDLDILNAYTLEGQVVAFEALQL